MIKTFDLQLRASYDRKADQIVLNADRSAHPELQHGGFHVRLKPGTQSDALLRQQMVQAGVLNFSPDGAVLGVQLETLLSHDDYKLARFVLESGRNIVFTGTTGSGKTTFLDACLNYLDLNTQTSIALHAEDLQEHDVNSSMKLHLVGVSRVETEEDFIFRVNKWVNDLRPRSVIAVDDGYTRIYSDNWKMLVHLTENKQTLYMTVPTGQIGMQGRGEAGTSFPSAANEARDNGFSAAFHSARRDDGEWMHNIHLL